MAAFIWFTSHMTMSVASAAADTMRSVRATGVCAAPFTGCVQVVAEHVPTPLDGEALVRVNASSVNPSDVDTVEMGGCTAGCGADFSGIVVACPRCKRLRVGDHVWGLASPAFADYVVSPEKMVGLKPPSLDVYAAASVPEVGLTSLFSLKRTAYAPGATFPAGSPWSSANFSNLTIAITAGAGGTGSIAIQLAKAWGAKHILTTATGADGLAYVRSLGATFVTDYKKEDLFASLPDDSVDVVYDNYGAEGTADKAMHAIRPGGAYLLLPHGECFEKQTQGPPCLAAKPKAGVRQLNYATGPDFEAHASQGLDELAAIVARGALSARIDQVFGLDDAARAFNFTSGPGDGGVGSHLGKVGLTMGAPAARTNMTRSTIAATIAAYLEGQPSPRSKCALQCSLESIGVYWACAAICIEKLAPNSCITAGCLAATAAADVSCLTKCPNTTTI